MRPSAALSTTVQVCRGVAAGAGFMVRGVSCTRSVLEASFWVVILLPACPAVRDFPERRRKQARWPVGGSLFRETRYAIVMT